MATFNVNISFEINLLSDTDKFIGSQTAICAFDAVYLERPHNQKTTPQK